MRVAEGYSLLAGAALEAGDIVNAEQAWKRAQPEFLRSYNKNDKPLRAFLMLGEQIRVAKLLPLLR